MQFFLAFFCCGCVDTRLRVAALLHQTGYTVTVDNQISIFVEPDMLTAGINLNIRLAESVVLCGSSKLSLRILRLSCICCVSIYFFCDLCYLLLLIHFPSVAFLADGHAAFDTGCREGVILAIGINRCRKICHIFFYSFIPLVFIFGIISIRIDRQPVFHGISVKNLCCSIRHTVCDTCAYQFI